MTERDQHRRWRWLLFLVAIALLSLVALKLVDLLDFSDSDSSAEAIAAVIALVGVVFTGTVSFIGIEVKRSLDERHLQLGREAEARLKLESTIKAVELFKGGFAAASPAEKAGAVFALACLSQHEFAIRLLGPLWQDGEIDLPSAVWIIEECLESGSQRAKEASSLLLWQNASRLEDRSEVSINFPEYSEENQSKDPLEVRNNVLAALLTLISSKPPNDWTSHQVAGLIGPLYQTIQRDPDDRTRRAAALAIERLLPLLEPGWAASSASVSMSRETLEQAVKKAKTGNGIYETHRRIIDSIPQASSRPEHGMP